MNKLYLVMHLSVIYIYYYVTVIVFSNVVN